VAVTGGAAFEPGDRGTPNGMLEALVRAKCPQALQSVDELRIPGVFSSDDQVDRFIAAVRERRRDDLG
jgi:hypothetical protein